jgi:hypothetical protein
MTGITTVLETSPMQYTALVRITVTNVICVHSHRFFALFRFKCGVNNLRHGDHGLILLTLSHKLQSYWRVFERFGCVYSEPTVSVVNLCEVASYIAHIPAGPPYTGTDAGPWVCRVRDLL